MNKNDIITMLHFNYWANSQILAACEHISNEEFIRPVIPDPGWGSLRGILVHTLDTEFGWRSALQALDDGSVLDENDFADLKELRVRWDKERSSWLDYVDGLSDQTINSGNTKDAQNKLKIWQTIFHVCAHGIQHRSEAAAILTGFGHSPGEIDFDLFLNENPQFY